MRLNSFADTFAVPLHLLICGWNLHDLCPFFCGSICPLFYNLRYPLYVKNSLLYIFLIFPHNLLFAFGFLWFFYANTFFHSMIRALNASLVVSWFSLAVRKMRTAFTPAVCYYPLGFSNTFMSFFLLTFQCFNFILIKERYNVFPP